MVGVSATLKIENTRPICTPVMSYEERYPALKAKLAQNENITDAEKIALMRSILQTFHGVWRMEMGPQLRETVLFAIDITAPATESGK